MNIKYLIIGFLVTFVIGGGVMMYSWFTTEAEVEDEEVSEITESSYQLEGSEGSANVKEDYEELMNQAEARISSLEEQVMEDMNGNASYMELYQKYQSAAKDLESNTDETFDNLHQQLLDEGEEDEAAVLKEQYQEQKKQWRQSIVEEVKDRL
ncbi:hypothetical protein [Salimicrobium flavidum]|uniref:Uncharacterized protein n=1 Tax=Salimicrobium flavidum TaxID=570947 RepID=A0A1N7IZT1_9BACI|nr:hypothetical protein [Salimicrobium flavidum]SIS42625.1 hypothetical protein SAMN05421687_10379 [Salimicrobium flavidum]